LVILSQSINKHGRHRQFLFLIGRFLKIFFSETAWPKWAEIWWEARMEGSVLSFLKAEWKVSDTCSARCWASSFRGVKIWTVYFRSYWSYKNAFIWTKYVIKWHKALLQFIFECKMGDLKKNEDFSFSENNLDIKWYERKVNILMQAHW
jgi:hypothetical protein